MATPTSRPEPCACPGDWVGGFSGPPMRHTWVDDDGTEWCGACHGYIGELRTPPAAVDPRQADLFGATEERKP